MLGLDIGDVVATLRMNTSQFESALTSAQQKIQKFGKNLQQIGSYLTLRATLPLVLFGRKAVKSFAALDDALTRSAAVTRNMSTSVRKDMYDLAIDLSRFSKIGAIEVAEGFFALGQAGYEGVQSLKAMPAALDFAVASSVTLDDSIRYLVRTINALSMSSNDAVENTKSLVKVSDALIYAAIATTAEVEDYAVAMTHAGAPALKLVNKGVREGTAALMAFALAGIQGEEAGTLLWTTIRDLQRAQINAKAQWKRFNLEVYTTADTFDKVKGSMRNVEDIFAFIS